MVIKAQVLALNGFGKGRDEDPDEEVWGEFEFEVLPKIGEDICLMRDDAEYVLAVKKIQHYPVPNPLPATEWTSVQRKKPFTRLIGEVRWME